MRLHGGVAGGNFVLLVASSKRIVHDEDAPAYRVVVRLVRAWRRVLDGARFANEDGADGEF